MDDIINQAFESTPAPVEVEAPIETPQVEEVATEETTPTETTESDDVMFPKKAVNAISRRDKQIGKLHAERAALKAELNKYREQQTQSAAQPLREESFDGNYGEYLKAQAKQEYQQEQAARTKEQEQQSFDSAREEWTARRNSEVVSKVDELMKTVPDYQQVFIENKDVLLDLSPELERAFLESDAPELAFYALAKEGRLDELFAPNITLARAAMIIAKAEARGEVLSKAKPVTKTPAPIEGLKGTGSSNKRISAESSPQELLKWLNTK